MICLQHLQQVEMTTSFILYYNMMWILKKMCPILAVDLCCYFILWCFDQENMFFITSKNPV